MRLTDHRQGGLSSARARSFQGVMPTAKDWIVMERQSLPGEALTDVIEWKPITFATPNVVTAQRAYDAWRWYWENSEFLVSAYSVDGAPEADAIQVFALKGDTPFPEHWDLIAELRLMGIERAPRAAPLESDL